MVCRIHEIFFANMGYSKCRIWSDEGHTKGLHSETCMRHCFTQSACKLEALRLEAPLCRQPLMCNYGITSSSSCSGQVPRQWPVRACMHACCAADPILNDAISCTIQLPIQKNTFAKFKSRLLQELLLLFADEPGKCTRLRIQGVYVLPALQYEGKLHAIL